MKFIIEVDDRLLALVEVVRHNFTATPKPPGVPEYQTVRAEEIAEHGWKPAPLTIEQALKACVRVGASALVHNSTVSVLSAQPLSKYRLGRALGTHAGPIETDLHDDDADLGEAGVIDPSLVCPGGGCK